MLKKITFVTGKNINLRGVMEDDAEFILSLRTDRKLGRFISKTDNDLKKQIEWIRTYFLKPNDHYFIIEGKDKTPYGTGRIYDIRDGSFNCGSWIIKKDAPQYVAIESVLLFYDVGFHKLGYKKAHFEVMKPSIKVLNMHKRFGARIVSQDEVFFYFNYNIDEYEKMRHKYRKYFPATVEIAGLTVKGRD